MAWNKREIERASETGNKRWKQRAVQGLFDMSVIELNEKDTWMDVLERGGRKEGGQRRNGGKSEDEV
jgi:hypothetical protein